MIKEYIEKTCQKLDIDEYSINNDFFVDVYGDVNLSELGLVEIPLMFNRVDGDFDCSSNDLESLDGSPKHVGGSFYCSYNNLTTLENAPLYVGDSFECGYNELETLKGGPENEIEFYDCNSNKLKNLNGAPSKVDTFFCSHNELKTFKGDLKEANKLIIQNNNIRSFYNFPKFNSLRIRRNPIFELWQFFENVNYIEYFNELDIIQENEKIVILDRLNYFLQDIGNGIEVSNYLLKDYKVK